MHLAYGFDSRRWKENWEAGRLIGINESSPYGYHRAAKHGVAVTFSSDARENVVTRFVRQVLRVVLGFDLVHAWRNRKSMLAADVVWTHTESQHLGVAAVLKIMSRSREQRPRLVAQSVWLFDQWDGFSTFRRSFYRNLMSRADVLTVHSPVNREVAQLAFPAARVEIVRFGICAEDPVPPRARPSQDRIRVLAVGNDRHRDWRTVIEAIEGVEHAELRIVSQSVERSLVRGAAKASVVTVQHNAQLLELYNWADVLVLPLEENRHASGITVLQESALRGVPVIASDTGGLRAYFDEQCVRYVRPHDVAALRSALVDLRNDPAERLRLARAAQLRMGPDGLSSESFVRRHCDLSAELFDSRRRPSDRSAPPRAPGAIPAARRSVADRFDPQDNGLNFLRLLLAGLVIVSHSWPIGGFGPDPVLGDITVGHLAVGAFFAVSGYLITQSRLRLRFAAFTWRRVLRIFPGFWMCLLVTAFVFAPAAAVVRGGWAPEDSLSYLTTNAKMLWGGMTGIGGTLDGAPYPAWNGSLWTLRYEVFCYVVTAVSLLVGVVRRWRWLTAAAFLGVTCTNLLFRATEGEWGPAAEAAWLGSFFMAGAVLLRYSDRIRLHGSGALVAAGALALTTATHTSMQVGALPVAYLCLWLAVALPATLRRIGSRNDLSYGVYLYGFPVQQLVVLTGVTHLGVGPFVLLSLGAVLPLAALSWLVVEQPAMRLKKLRFPFARPFVRARLAHPLGARTHRHSWREARSSFR